MGATISGHHGAAEQAGPGLLEAEADELVGEGGRAALAAQWPSAPRRDEAGERRPVGGGAGLSGSGGVC